MLVWSVVWHQSHCPCSNNAGHADWWPISLARFLNIILSYHLLSPLFSEYLHKMWQWLIKIGERLPTARLNTLTTLDAKNGNSQHKQINSRWRTLSPGDRDIDSGVSGEPVSDEWDTGLEMYETHVTQHQQTEYQPSLWAVLLHQLPHVNITFHRLEDERFRPDSELYLESLGIIGSVPAAILILTLIILLIYLLTRCCDTKNNKVTYDSHYIHWHNN